MVHTQFLLFKVPIYFYSSPTVRRFMTSHTTKRGLHFPLRHESDLRNLCRCCFPISIGSLCRPKSDNNALKTKKVIDNIKPIMPPPRTMPMSFSISAPVLLGVAAGGCPVVPLPQSSAQTITASGSSPAGGRKYFRQLQNIGT